MELILYNTKELIQLKINNKTNYLLMSLRKKAIIYTSISYNQVSQIQNKK